MPDPSMTIEPRNSYEVALKQIETCRRKKATILDLSGLGLSALPPEIGQLTALMFLDLSGNQLNILPPEIGQLTALIRLDLDSNQLSALPPEIGQLTALTELYLASNQLSALTPEIGQLTALTELYLASNQLSALPPEIGQLTELTTLALSSNQLSAFPPEIGQLTALTTLDLSSNQLSALPPEIGQLTALTALHLHANQLSALPPEIGQLTALTVLYLSSNQLSALPPEIGRLTELTELYLFSNQLSALPPEIGQLTELMFLDLSGNQLNRLPQEIGRLTALRDLSLHANQLQSLLPEIGRLTALTHLSLGWNQLKSLPPEIRQLTALTWLHLSANQLVALPAEIRSFTELSTLWLQDNRLTALPEWLMDLRNLEHLFLHGNSSLKLSPSILGPDPREDRDGLAAARSILDFYFGRKPGRTRSLNEVKLILVGRGGAGKTSTVNALRGLPFHEGEESTPGIALCDWQMDGCKGEPVTAHVWDFAGQVITHALHQFFFSTRCVYVVVLTGRENNEREDAEYWLRLIKAFGTDGQGEGPPVVVALNKWDVPGCRPRVDRGALQERYPFIRGFVEMDCKSNKGLAKLKATLCREVSKLKWVREPFPTEWDEVRRTLSAGKKRRAHLPYSDYRSLCVKHGVTSERKQDSLSEILHNLGAALNYRNDPRLREATVLLPDWLTTNVYALVRRAEKQAGTLKQADVDVVLKKEKDAAMRKYLVHLMERFEIAYAPKSTGGVWLVPQALPDTQPAAVSAFRDAEDATRLRYTYTALPEGLVARAIVRLHEFIEIVGGKRRQWASGAILFRDGARALIRTEPQDRQVTITVIGPAKVRQQLAGLCQAEMRDIHDDIRGLDPLEETEFRGEWISVATLEVDEQKGQATGVSTKAGTVTVNPSEPNNAFSERLSRIGEIWKPTVFISYSKSNLTQRKRLESELKILMNEGLLARQWHDRMIDPGDEWDSKIQRELAEADVVIVMVSAAALSTDYITNHEIPKAMELHRAGQTVVVPVILENCRWSKTALGDLNALPEKAKALNTWNPQSNAWNSVSDGLATVFRNLMANPRLQKRRADGLSRGRR